jgi:adenine-specific DNA-methyltransferase
MAKKKNSQKTVTRYTHDDVKEARTPETGHTPLLPAEEQVVTLPMDNGWTKAAQVGRLPEDERPVVLDMDPAADPVLFWAGKRNKREIPILPLQRNEIVSESRIAQIIERARRAAAEKEPKARQGFLFADLEKTLRESEKGKRVEFYTHDEGWKNKLICGDSLQVMESLLHYEGLRGKVQMIYIDPPYGIKYDSNFQQRVDSTKNDEKDQADDVLTIKAFRDTWALGVHSYLSYLQERLYLCRELLADSGSIFVQIGDENSHLVRALLDEVFGKANALGQIVFLKSSGRGATYLDALYDTLLWYAKDITRTSYYQLYVPYEGGRQSQLYKYLERPDGREIELTDDQLEGRERIPEGRRFKLDPLNSAGETATGSFEYRFGGKSFVPPRGRHWSLTKEGLDGLARRRRLYIYGRQLRYKRYGDDLPFRAVNNVWDDAQKGTFVPENDYVVQTASKVVERCILMTTLPGDLALDPTCGSGTTAFVAEKWGRRWITCDTSRVAVNIARRRLLSSIFEHYKIKSGTPTSGFIYKSFEHKTPGSLAYDLEPEKVDLVDQPEPDRGAIRICGPFEVMTLGRYSIEDWKGYVVREPGAEYGEPAKLENYIGAICRLYRRDAAIQGANGLVHAVAESEKEKIAISVGPLSGRVTAKQINDAVQDALASGILEVHVLGWAFEANVGEVKSQLESRGKVKVQLIMIRPDTLAEGLKATQPEMLFSPLALPNIEFKLATVKGGAKEAVVTLKGVGVFDRRRRTTDYYRADSGYVAAWYLDEDYDGDCFVDCQMFFDFGKIPNLKAALKAEVDPEEFRLQLTSQPFLVRGYKRIAVKVVDVYGNESTVVRELR